MEESLCLMKVTMDQLILISTSLILMFRLEEGLVGPGKDSL